MDVSEDTSPTGPRCSNQRTTCRNGLTSIPFEQKRAASGGCLRLGAIGGFRAPVVLRLIQRNDCARRGLTA